ncbi:MAG: lipopolysaccharide biosynthesis protein [Bacteroides sp.]|nr:lipopolysaccharide biosynthesis protein [Bacteroides sp.]
MAEQTLKEKTAKGLFWGGLSNGLQQLLNLLFGIFLARLLTPDDYGMVGMLSIFSLIAASLQESGFTAALVNRKEAGHEDFNAVFWFNVLCSACLYTLLFFCAPLIAAFYGVPELTALARYTFLGFFISSLGIAHSAYLFRNLMVKQRAMASVVALTVSGITGIMLAWNGLAYWGIATQSLVYITTNTAFYWYFSPWRPTFRWHFAPVREMFGFSSRLLITNIFNHINHNLFSILLGKLYTEKEVGYYNQANKWCGMGQMTILGMVNGVVQPVFARTAEEQERQRQIFRKMLRLVSFVSFPAMLGLGFVAEELITIAVTDKWLPSADMMHILCVGGAFVPLTHLYQQFIISRGKSQLFMWNTICVCVCLLMVSLATYGYGIKTMLTAYVALNIGWLLVWHYFVWKEIGIRLIHALKDVLPFALIASGVLLLTYFLTLPISNIYLRLAGKVLLAAALYIGTMWLCRSVTFMESMEYLFKKKKA